MSVHKIMQLVRCYVSGKQMKEKEREKSSAGGKFGMTGILKKRGNACRSIHNPVLNCYIWTRGAFSFMKQAHLSNKQEVI